MDRGVVGVVALAMDERSTQTLALAFKHRAAGRCALVDEACAHVAVVDMDSRGALQSFRDFRARWPTMPTIALATQTPQATDVVHVPKPVSVTRLVELVHQLASAGQEEAMATKVTQDKIEQALKAIDAKRTAGALDSRVGAAQEHASALKRNLATKADQMYFDPGRFLLGRIQTALEEARTTEQALVVTCWDDKTVVFDPTLCTTTTSLTDSQVRNLAIVPCDGASGLSVTMQYHDRTSRQLASTPGTRVLSTEVFLWNLGVLTSRGRVPSGTEINERMYLLRWPNLTRVVLPRHAMRVLAYWIQQPCALLRMFELLEVPMNDIFSLYSGAHAAGLAGPAKRQSDFLVDHAPLENSDRRRVFSAILRRLLRHGEPKQQIA